MDEVPQVDDGLLATIKGFFAARGLEMPERNSKQAWLIPSAVPLPNPVGTAPGWFVRSGEKLIVAMPGVPREMFRMWSEQVLPRLQMLQSGRAVRSATIKTIGIGESLVEQTLHELVARANPLVATYAKDDGVHVRVTAVAETDAAAIAKRDGCVADIRRLIGPHIYGVDSESLPGAILGLLDDASFSIAVRDSGGGGRFAAMLAAHPGFEQVFCEARLLPESTTSARELAERAAGDARANLGVGIAVNFEELEPNVYAGAIDVAVRGALDADRSFTIRSGYEDIQRRSALFAAEVLRSALLTT
jgi:nicotinamide-nucleotide amidase